VKLRLGQIFDVNQLWVAFIQVMNDAAEEIV
jgi:hypothetical protein